MSLVASGKPFVLQQRRRTVVQGFLWILLAVVALVMVVNIFLLGGEAFTVVALVPNLLFCGVIGFALWLNHRDRFRLALGFIIGLILVASSVPLALGAGDNTVALFMLFIPAVLAGLLLDRRALFLTGGLTLLVVLGAPALRQSGLLQAGLPVADGVWLSTLQFVAVYAIVVFFFERFGSSLNEALAAAADREVALQLEMTQRRETEGELRGERNFSKAIIDSLPGVFCVIDNAGRFHQWNRNLEQLTAYSAAELALLKPPDLVEGADALRFDYGLGEEPDDRLQAVEANLVTKGGERIPYVFTGVHFAMGGETYLAGIGFDTIDLNRAQSHIQDLNGKLNERLERLNALHEIDKAIIGSLDLGLTLDVVLRQVTELLGVKAANVLLYKPQSQVLRFGAGRGFKTADALHKTMLRLGQGLAGSAALRREKVFVNDPDELKRLFAQADKIADEGFHCYLAVPLVAKGQLQGILELFHDSKLEPNDSWWAFLDALAAQTAIALDNATLFSNLERMNTELLLAYDTTIEGWARALDLRDHETEGHSRRVTELTVRLAEQVGVTEDQLVHIRRGALLHDIGKMGVPDSILLKPGKLEPDEWEVMQQHTTYAFELLQPIPFLRSALDIPYAHHERWDGTGYPRGLAGEMIPLAARIFSVVDVYDALSSDRPYRAAWPAEKIHEYMREQAGSQFDPAVVEAFLEMLEQQTV